ncbi:caspase family protein [Pacificispira sp.]|uniref:caspase family protein n=1 Tax=Pacificispira sp. TaxID=2888761 RepID=UPI003BAD9CAA
MARTPLAMLLGIMMSLIVAANSAAAETRMALVIGNGNYATAPLQNPPNDARLVGDTLESLGFTVSRHSDLDQRALKRAVLDYGEALAEAGPDTINVIYYAGHGVQIQGRNYLIPVKAQIEHERDVPIEAVAADEILQSIAYAETQLNIVILDACRNNPYARSFRSSETGLARMDAPRGTLLAYSTAPGSVAADGTGRYSPYARALARAMNLPGLPIEEVFKRARIDVMEHTAERQVPWESSSLTGNFSFVPAAAAGDVAAQSREAVFWSSIAAQDDPALFEEYLTRYPDGLFRSIAESRLAALSGAASAPPRAARTGPVRFKPGTYDPAILRSETECAEVRFQSVTLEPESGKGFWLHPDTTGTVQYRIEDGIVGVKFKGTLVSETHETVQIQGSDLFVRIRVIYAGGVCKIAYWLKGAIGP